VVPSFLCQPISSRSCQPHKRRTPPQLRLLAPKSLSQPVQHRLQSEHNNIQYEQDTEAFSTRTANVIPSVSLPLLFSALASAADDSLPGLVYSDRVTPGEHFGLSTQHPPYGNKLQLQETIQNRQDQDYWLPMHHDVAWAAMVQPTIGVQEC